METRTVIELDGLAKFEKGEVIKEMIGVLIMEAIELHENTVLYLENENKDMLVSSLKKWGEHRNFDSEFSIEVMGDQNWYYLCNGVLYLKDMVKATQKVLGISRDYQLSDNKLFIKVIGFIKEDVDFLYSKFKEEFSHKINFCVV
ncbi:hypothetical protein VBD025_02765 [Virgibacillus flavescens]|uniref:hypothetical protein n=1 Tax=Virgibacillus flavescens TaxID=1611422 RepID=UPI003D352CDF